MIYVVRLVIATLMAVAVTLGLTASVANATHLGVPASDMVTLAFSSNGGTPCPNNPGFFVVDGRVGADGEVSRFTIPEGSLLVVTDFEWTQVGTSPPSRVITNQLLIGPAKGTPHIAAMSSAMSDSSGSVGASEHFTAGIVVGSGKVLCLDGNRGFIHGYFAK